MVALSFKGAPLVPLNTVVTVTSLGEFTFSGTIPTASELDAQVKVKNTGYTVNNATYTSITATGATMNGIGLYTGSVTLSFSKTPAFLSELYGSGNVNLGNINFNSPDGLKPTREQLIANLKEKNPNFKVKNESLLFDTITEKQALVVGDNITCKGNIIINYKKN